MSNIFSTNQRIIPTEEDEVAVRQMNGILFVNNAYHCRPKDLWPSELVDAKPEWVRAMELYLANFCRPIQSIAREVKCVACDKQLTGAYAHMADWRHASAVTVNTSSATLEGRCSGCGYPVRCRHEIKLPDGRTLVRLDNFPLCYHPSATERAN